MMFQNAAQQACYEKIAGWVKEIYAGATTPAQDLPLFLLRQGSTAAAIEVLPWGEAEAIISIWSYVVTDVEIDPDLLRYLLKLNDRAHFCGFSMDDDGDIRIHATLLGTSCDRTNLSLAVKEVLDSGDRYDDEIVARWGGRRVIDHLGKLALRKPFIPNFSQADFSPQNSRQNFDI
ncbi:T3SS (YopN, CesT) and YbjN peptide-binding chaperone 1 [Tumidithrix helvetica PCC 7403]|uniref:T3SS (YopN, CesT) and YbjN peptide-binding chaperone 1 n=1 Tax=Tumidithrix helvetica TaxID=3457545 RepID=UPI003CB7F01F